MPSALVRAAMLRSGWTTSQLTIRLSHKRRAPPNHPPHPPLYATPTHKISDRPLHMSDPMSPFSGLLIRSYARRAVIPACCCIATNCPVSFTIFRLLFSSVPTPESYLSDRSAHSGFLMLRGPSLTVHFNLKYAFAVPGSVLYLWPNMKRCCRFLLFSMSLPPVYVVLQASQPSVSSLYDCAFSDNDHVCSYFPFYPWGTPDMAQVNFARLSSSSLADRFFPSLYIRRATFLP